MQAERSEMLVVFDQTAFHLTGRQFENIGRTLHSGVHPLTRVNLIERDAAEIASGARLAQTPCPDAGPHRGCVRATETAAADGPGIRCYATLRLSAALEGRSTSV